MFGDRLAMEAEVNHIIEFKYVVEGETRGLRLATEVYPSLKLTGFLVIEQVGKCREGRTPVTIHVVTGKEIYDQMADATFANAFSLEQDRDRMPITLVETIDQWLKIRRKLLQDNLVPGCDKITATKLRTYVSERMAKIENTRLYALVGDAAAGFIYFRGLNVGFRCVTELVRAIVEHRKLLLDARRAPSTNKSFVVTALRTATGAVGHMVITPKRKQYEAFVRTKATFEVQASKVKNLALQTSFSANQFMGNVVPPMLQANRWSKSEVAAINSSTPESLDGAA